MSHKGTGAECPTGHYCPKGSTVPLPCEAGTYALTTGILTTSTTEFNHEDLIRL